MSACSRRDFLKGSLAAGATVAGGLAMPAILGAQEPIKVGVLHSLSGTMAISEAPLKEVILMAIAEVNASGGVMGRKVEAVVEDPASNWDLFAEKSKKLLLQDKVAAVFGCWTSVSRKSVLPVFEKNNGLLFYPVQYEGEECSKNVIYTGATINQQATPGVDYLMGPDGGARKKFYLLGSDYVYPRTTNKILRMYLNKTKKVPDSAIAEEYTPVPPPGLSDDRRQDQELRGGRRRRGHQHHQRRQQRALLQGAGQPGADRRQVPGHVLQLRRGRAADPRRQAAGRAPGVVELLHVASRPPRTSSG